ncbi:MAG: hypothetical protein GY847_31630, partial [Proteobacteria bacterium]|nr:hypothetical protein [Pseudomonadota bacterium]
MAKHLVVLLCWVLALTIPNACSTDEESEKPEIVLGSILHEDISDKVKSRYRAVQLAIDEINASGALDFSLSVQNLSPAKNDTADMDRASEHT